MRISQIKQKLHGYIDTADVKKLKALHTLLIGDLIGYQLSEEQKAELGSRRDDYKNVIGETLSWEETVAMTDKALTDGKNQIKNGSISNT